MGRRRQPKTAREKIASVIAWAQRSGFTNIAAALQEALSLLPTDNDERRR